VIDKPAHLTDEAAQVLLRPDHERINFIRSKRWIPYTRAKQVLDQLEHLLNHPRTTRMPSLAIYGDSGVAYIRSLRETDLPAFFGPRLA